MLMNVRARTHRHTHERNIIRKYTFTQHIKQMILNFVFLVPHWNVKYNSKHKMHCAHNAWVECETVFTVKSYP